MNARRPQAGSGRTASGAEALRAALRRLRAAGGALAQPPANGQWPPPQTDWEHAAEVRLSKIEAKLNSQNRLLLIALVSILADVVLGLAR